MIAGRFAVTHVVHNAGVIRPALLPDVKLDDLDALTQLHLGAAITLMQAALPAMKQDAFRPHRPDVVARRARLADAHRLFGDQGRHDRHGADLGARACRRWHHRQRRRARTDRAIPRCFAASFRANSEREKALAEAIPVKRLGRSDDVARAVMFFCDRANGFVTGQTLYVCGGASVGTIVI